MMDQKKKLTIGIAADHGGFLLKEKIKVLVAALGFEVQDFGAHVLDPADDFPDFVAPLAEAVSKEKVYRGIAICGSGVGACIVANKIKGVRACLITDTFSAHQGVEDDHMNVLCLGGRITGASLAEEIVITFCNAEMKTEERFLRRINKIKTIENYSGQ